ncbi:HNH endonuclease [Pseudanabaena biceps]|nr:HNH endonuclease [Pseudanabaena biceps]
MRAYVKDYSSANKDGVAERSAIRRERKAFAAGNGYTDEDILEIRKILEDRCAYCDAQLADRWHIDHMTPVVQGGRTEVSNLTLCCEKCNFEKHAKNVEQFLYWRIQRGLKNRNPRVV